MKRFVEGQDRRQATLLPDCLDDDVTEDNPVRIVEAFIDELDLAALGFAGIVKQGSATCWPPAPRRAPAARPWRPGRQIDAACPAELPAPTSATSCPAHRLASSGEAQ